MSASSSRLPDVMGIGISGLCLAHCLALPIVAALFPLLGALSHSGWIHILFLVLAAPVSVLALKGTGTWRDRRVAGFFLFGIAGLAAGLPWGWPEAVEVGLTSLGGASLVAAHLLNLRRSLRPAPLAGTAKN